MPSRSSRMTSTTLTPAPFSVPVSQPSTRCATVERARATPSPSSASEAWATSPSSTRPRAVIAPSPSPVAQTRVPSPSSSAHTSTSTPPRRTRPRNCRNWAAPNSSSPPSPAPRPWSGLSTASPRPASSSSSAHPMALSSESIPHAARPPYRHWLALRHRHGFRRHAQLQRAHRHQAHDRDLTPRKSRRCLSPA